MPQGSRPLTLSDVNDLAGETGASADAVTRDRASKPRAARATSPSLRRSAGMFSDAFSLTLHSRDVSVYPASTRGVFNLGCWSLGEGEDLGRTPSRLGNNGFRRLTLTLTLTLGTRGIYCHLNQSLSSLSPMCLLDFYVQAKTRNPRLAVLLIRLKTKIPNQEPEAALCD